MKKIMIVLVNLMFFSMLLVAVPVKAATVTTTESTTSALSASFKNQPIATIVADGWAVLGALVITVPGATYFGKKIDQKQQNVSINKDKTLLSYRGHHGTVEHINGNHELFGHVVGIGRLVLYEGSDFEELENDFHEAVDEYMAKHG